MKFYIIRFSLDGTKQFFAGKGLRPAFYIEDGISFFLKEEAEEALIFANEYFDFLPTKFFIVSKDELLIQEII